uniref:CSON011983 protein n=1 Tax=Culicoides sonorensis TaxID=179676 RepID=A0A336KKL6_CULSO
MEKIENDSPIYFDTLPNELLIMIMRYLSPTDRRNAACVCKKFSEIAFFVSNISLSFNYSRLSDDCAPMSIFLKSRNNYSRIILGGDIEFGASCEKFWSKFGKFITEITFDYCPFLSVEILTSILKEMKQLQKLHIFCRKEFFLSGSKLIDDRNRDALSRALHTVTELSLNGTNITNVQLSNLLDLIPDLETLSLSFCSTPSEGLKETETEHYLKCEDILVIIKEHCPKLKDIYLDDFGYRILDEKLLVKGMLDLNLRKLCFPLEQTSSELVEFLEQQQGIQVFGMSYGIHTSCENLSLISQHLPSIKELNIRNAKGHLRGLKLISGLDKLEVFRLANHTNSFEFEEGYHICYDVIPKPKLKTFELNSSTKICDDCCEKLTQQFPNLTVLKLTHSQIGDAAVQLIFKNLTKLRKLVLTGCREISDVGMIGWRLPNNDNQQNGNKIAMQEYSIANLKGLQSLDISGCEEITNVSFLTSFRLLELRKFKASNLKKISGLGIEALVQGCPQIEVIDLGGCESLNDDCIKLISNRLKRLKFLDIHGCKSLTDAAWQFLATNCKSLQILNSWNCNMTIFLSDMLFSRIESLKLILYEQKCRRFEYDRRKRSL